MGENTEGPFGIRASIRYNADVLQQLSPVLIANRGEIAVRVASTVRALGLASVAVYSDADAHALHVQACDSAVRLGPAPARESYLDVEKVLAAARASGARSVHPGYGFLSENAAFARAVIDAGLIWIGPPVEAIELMGDKGAAKEAAKAAGVPVVPEGVDGGYPVMVKAVAGGGGKGMRVVRSAEELDAATEAAGREALAAFGNAEVIIEKYLEQPRHIEVQVLADRHGTVIHLGERECSLQRRHQKVVEEAPSPVVDQALRARMGESAVALARACGYEGAGTVEFIFDGSDFYFLEMNTRLQVEHPVTELVHDVDLVEQQLRAAAGLQLTAEQGEPVGWAMEARLYAEDPAAGFLPATGTVRVWADRSLARVDTGFTEGAEVTTFYDPMLAKVIAYGPDRLSAIDALDTALAELGVLGVQTNAGFTRALLAREDVRAGQMDTGLLERVLPDLGLQAPEDLRQATAEIGAFLDAEAFAATTSVPPGWRADGTRAVWRRRVDDGVLEVAGEPAVVREDDCTYLVTVEGVTRRYLYAADGNATWCGRDGYQLELTTTRAGGGSGAAGADALVAPMPGTILLVNVANGDTVAEGEVLLVMESMKMELQISAPHAGVVADLELKPGDKVALKQTLVNVEAQS